MDTVLRQPSTPDQPVASESTDRSLRDDFLVAFAESILETDLSTLKVAWAGSRARTVLYNGVLAKVAKRLNLRLERELLVVDYAMTREDDQVPRVFIESENVASFAVQEVRKLCCLSAPLKVLLSVCEWDKTEGLWSKGSIQTTVLGVWRQECEKHKAAGTLVGDVVAIVGEWRPDSMLKFYAVQLNEPNAMGNCFVSRPVGSPIPRGQTHDPLV